jgi:hypothetical protein
MSDRKMPAGATPPPNGSADLQQCLPESLREPSTVITRIPAGMSGAGVNRVEAGSSVSY